MWRTTDRRRIRPRVFRETRPRAWRHSLALVLGIATLAGSTRADEGQVETTPCRVLYRTAEGIYVDLGEEHGLEVGSLGRLRRANAEFARAEVLRVARRTALLRVFSTGDAEAPAAGETLELEIQRAPPGSEPRKRSETFRGPGNAEDPFVPLLVTPDLGDQAYTDTENILHGRVTLRQVFQLTPGANRDGSATRLLSSGSFERIDGTPWALEWSTGLSFRSGGAYDGSIYEDATRLDLWRLSLFRRFDDRGFVRLGRFLPLELPSAGFLDGAHGEISLSPNLRAGGLLGFRPKRDRLTTSFRELTGAGYLTLGLESDDAQTSYSGTAGLLATLWDGTPDRLAFVVDQTLRSGDFSLLATSELDFDVGASNEVSGPRLTRLDVVAEHALADWFRPRAGVVRYELVDTEAQRDLLDPGLLAVEDFFDDEYWRFWIGASHDIARGWRLSEEIAFFDSTTLPDALRWRVSLSKRGLPGLTDGSFVLTLFNVAGTRSSGYGGRASLQIPCLDHRLLLEPGLGVRYLDVETTNSGRVFLAAGTDQTVVDLGLRAHYRLGSKWSLSAGASYQLTSEDDRFLADVALTWRF